MIPFFRPVLLFVRTLSGMLERQEFRSLCYIVLETLGLGTFVYHNLEGWTWLDSLYFSVITLTTVGYGDFSPQTAPGKLFTIFYIFAGLGLLLGFVSVVGEQLVEDGHGAMQRRQQKRKTFTKNLRQKAWPEKPEEKILELSEN